MFYAANWQLREGSLPCSIGERTGVAVVTRLLSSSDLESECVTPTGRALQVPESTVHMHFFASSPYGLAGGDDLLRLRDIAPADHSARLRMAGDMIAAMRSRRRPLCPSATLGKRVRRYWQLADSDDALPPRGALSTAAFRRVTERSDERIEGQTFDLHDGP